MQRYRPAELALAYYLSGLAGFIDAMGFLYLGGFFLSFMSGNTTRLTAALSEAHWAVAGKAAGLMALFLLGVAAGALVHRLAQRHLSHGRAREAVLITVSVTSTMSAVSVLAGAELAAVLFLSFTVGAMNSVFERDGEVALSLTYMTGTLVKMAQRFVDGFYGGSRTMWLQHLLMWFSLTVGSLIGGLCYQWLGLQSVVLVAAQLVTATVVTISVRQSRRRRGLPL